MSFTKCKIHGGQICVTVSYDIYEAVQTKNPLPSFGEIDIIDADYYQLSNPNLPKSILEGYLWGGLISIKEMQKLGIKSSIIVLEKEEEMPEWCIEPSKYKMYCLCKKCLEEALG